MFNDEWRKIVKEINIRDFKIEKGSENKIELIYIPDQDQILKSGQEYKFILIIEDDI